MGNTSFFNDPPDLDLVAQGEGSTSDEQRLVTFYQDGMTLEESGAGSLLDLLTKAVARAEAAADRAEAAQAESEAILAEMQALTAQLDHYLGAFDLPPTERPSGDPLEVGDLYYDLPGQQSRVWTGVEWRPFADTVGPAGLIGPAGLPGL